mmetsp:Transcript_32536/g.73490  ORF Transcript_32536/g.73490 Transcript_32536/m.73490 type:complete len:674 (+) Transcript_32536:131-2152(+)
MRFNILTEGGVGGGVWPLSCPRVWLFYLAHRGLGVAIIVRVAVEAGAEAGLAVAGAAAGALGNILVDLGELGLDRHLLRDRDKERGLHRRAAGAAGPLVGDVLVVHREGALVGEDDRLREGEVGHGAEHVRADLIVLRLRAHDVVRGVRGLHLEPLLRGLVHVVLLAEDHDLGSLVLLARAALGVLGEARSGLDVEVHVPGEQHLVGRVVGLDDVPGQGHAVVERRAAALHVVLARLEEVVVRVHEAVRRGVEVLVDVRVLGDLALLDDAVVAVHDRVGGGLRVGGLRGQVVDEQVLDVARVAAVVVELVPDARLLRLEKVLDLLLAVVAVRVLVGLVHHHGHAERFGRAPNVSRADEAALVRHLVVEGARHRVLDLVVGEVSHDLRARGVVARLVGGVVERVQDVLLAVHVVDGQVELALHPLAADDLHKGLLEVRGIEVVLDDAIRRVEVIRGDEERVHAVAADLHRAVGPHEPGIALAPHGQRLVPELVGNVADGRQVADAGVVRGEAVHGVIALGEVAVLAVLRELLDGLARAVARAVVGARGALARRTLVAGEALAGAVVAVAHALVGALHVEVALVRGGVRVLLGGAEGVHGGAQDERVVGARQGARGAVEVALGRVNVRVAEGAGALRAVVALPVAAARALVVERAGAVAGARVGALRRSVAHQSQ